MTENSSPPARNWGDMKYDILVKIFMTLNFMDLGSVSSVCSSWRRACTDPTLWNKLDLSHLNFQSVDIPFIWSDDESTAKLTNLLKHLLDLSRGQISCLIFHFLVHIKDGHLVAAAERTPNLKRLVLPYWSKLSENGINQAMQLWEGLECLTIPTISSPYHILAAIGKYCPNFSELKLTCDFHIGLADALINHVPNLKVLSVRSTTVSKEALDHVLLHLDHLEVLNISHCLIMEVTEAPRINVVVHRQTEVAAFLNLSRLRKLITCQGEPCAMCKQACYDNLDWEWHQYQETFWREDEIPSLAL